jgi:serine/threonine protein kinase
MSYILFYIGTFGQVFRCQRDGTKDMVAVKIIKNKSAYHRQGTIEIAILKQLNKECERKDHHGVVKLIDSFEHKQHICIVFELLQMSLLDVLTQNHFRGLPIHIVQRFTKQILQAMCLIEQANIIHCDIKPENILLSNIPSVLQEEVNNDNGNATEPITTSIGNEGGDKESTAKDRNELHSSGKSPGVGTLGDIKVIDFGSACFEGKTAYRWATSSSSPSPSSSSSSSLLLLLLSSPL